MIRICLLPMSLCIVAAIGCSNLQQTGRVDVANDWPTARDNLGRTALLIDEPPSHKGQLTAKAQDTLSKLPGTTVVDPSTVLSTLGPDALCHPLGDVSLMDAARQNQVDTVCLLRINGSPYRFAIGLLPPYLDARGTFAYDLRILDARSGRLLLDARRKCILEGQSYDAFCQACPDLLATDLTTILAASDESCPQP